MRYEDFVVQLGPETGDGVAVRAASPAGDARGFLSFSIAPEEIEAEFSTIVRARRRAAARSVERACEIGKALFEALFHGDVEELLERSLGYLEREKRGGLRIELKLDLSDTGETDLHSLPWEIAYRAKSGDFLGLSRRTPIVRYLELPRALPAFSLSGPLRVLSLAPEPRGQPTLDLAAERHRLEELAQSVDGLEVEVLGSSDLGTLRRALVEREVHVLHLMGHADFDDRTGRGVLCLEGADGRDENVAAESLVAAIADCTSLQLVVLNACNTARAGAGLGAKPFLGLAPALMRAGLPAVLAMQSPISDAAAIAFSEAFYRRLASGDPLDAAMIEGRHSIHARGPRPLEWAVPVLFLRTAADAVATSPATGASSALPRALAHLHVGNFEEAIGELRQERAERPFLGLPMAALAIALARGRPLRQLPYQTAKEMHHLLAAALPTADGGGAAAAALLALKLDYFGGNGVREPAPPREEVTAALAGIPRREDDARLLACLRLAEDTSRMLEPGFGEEAIR